MNAGKTVFAQILEHLPRYEFDKFVKKYEGNHRVRRFPCYDQFLCLACAQLTYRESLRDIETCLNSHHEKLYHVGFRGQISRSTMADSGEKRDYRIYQDFAYHLPLDQATSENQNLLRHIAQRRQNPDLDRRQHLSAGRHPKKASSSARQSPHNFANSGGQHF